VHAGRHALRVPGIHPEGKATMFAILALLQEEEGLTIGKLLRDIPHDLPALIVYLLLGGFIGMIWLGNRSKRDDV
jgi:hypothetical protein